MIIDITTPKVYIASFSSQVAKYWERILRQDSRRKNEESEST
jgi:hypothetical protein